MSPEQMQLLSDVLYEVIEAEYRNLRDEGVPSQEAQSGAKSRVRNALRDLLYAQLQKTWLDAEVDSLIWRKR